MSLRESVGGEQKAAVMRSAECDRLKHSKQGFVVRSGELIAENQRMFCWFLHKSGSR